MIIKYATSVLCSRSQFPHLWPRKEDVVDQKRRSGSQADVLLGVVRADGVGQNVERRQVPFQALLGQVPVVRSRRSRTRPRRPRWCHHLFHFFFGAIGSSLTDSENATKLPGPNFPGGENVAITSCYSIVGTDFPLIEAAARKGERQSSRDDPPKFFGHWRRRRLSKYFDWLPK